MSNRLDDSVGSELIADDEKSINERMKGNSINAYRIKMKSDLQKNIQENNINNLENPQFSQNLNHNNYMDRDSFINSLSYKQTCDQSSNNRYYNQTINHQNSNSSYNQTVRNTNNKLFANNSVGRIFSNTCDTTNNISLNHSNTLNPGELTEKKKLTSLILEKEDEINFSKQKYEHLKLNFNDKKRNHIAKCENFNKIKNANLQMKKLIALLLQQRIEKEKDKK